MFDPEKPFATCGMGQRIFYQQDGVYYNPSTKEPVDLSTLSKPKIPAPAATGLVCTFCGAQRDTPELFREHLLAVHREQVPELKADPNPTVKMDVQFPAPTEPAAPSKPAGKSKGKGK